MNWRESLQSALKTTSDLEAFFEWPIPHVPYSAFIPQDFAQKIKDHGPDSALAKQFLPSQAEGQHHLNETSFLDPIGDQQHLKTKQLIHRYSNRALFIPTSVCPIHCRYCFRKNELGAETIFSPDLEDTIQYLKEHNEINEIIFTGGDPLMLSNQKIDFYLSTFAQLSHIKFIRFHSRMPVILPKRIDDELTEILAGHLQHFKSIHFALHINHVDEWSDQLAAAMAKLHHKSIELIGQTVLLKGVNDQAERLLALFETLIEHRVRPYYLHHPDQVRGGMHFYLDLEVGRRIYAQLRSQLPGWAIPHYVVDIPGGEGKVSAFNPETFDFSGNLINKDGKPKKYHPVY